MEIHPKSINKMKFKMFLENLRSKYYFDDILLIMDNLSFHKSKDVKERMDELGFMYTYTPAYSPQYNGIEEVINIGK
jgi:transposase